MDDRPSRAISKIKPGARVLVVKLSSLGDLFHGLPVAHLLKSECGATVDWVTQPEYVDLVRCFADVDRVISFPRRRVIAGFRTFRRELRRERYDCVLDLQGLFKSGWVSRLARSNRRVGPADHCEGSRIFYTEVVGARGLDRHSVERALDTAENLGLSRNVEPLRFRLPRVDLGEVRPRIALVPCSRWPTKNWPPERFVEAGSALQARVGARLYVIGGPADEAVCAEIARALPGSTNFCGAHGLPETAAVMAGMDVVVTVDTGPMHMAAALGIPVVAIFGPTNPERTGPYGRAHRVVRASGLDCMPCLSRTCSRRDLACQDRVSAHRVIENVISVLAEGEAIDAPA